MEHWPWPFCIPELVWSAVALVIGLYVGNVWGETTGWESGFMDAMDLKDEEEAERRLSGTEPSATDR